MQPANTYGVRVGTHQPPSSQTRNQQQSQQRHNLSFALNLEAMAKGRSETIARPTSPQEAAQ